MGKGSRNRTSDFKRFWSAPFWDNDRCYNCIMYEAGGCSVTGDEIGKNEWCVNHVRKGGAK
ncbi:MAG: hypothetical protein ACYTEQ_00825 [Planctomycetota bacterium]|jgi:hypothetical protein